MRWEGTLRFFPLTEVRSSIFTALPSAPPCMIVAETEVMSSKTTQKLNIYKLLSLSLSLFAKVNYSAKSLSYPIPKLRSIHIQVQALVYLPATTDVRTSQSQQPSLEILYSKNKRNKN